MGNKTESQCTVEVYVVKETECVIGVLHSPHTCYIKNFSPHVSFGPVTFCTTHVVDCVTAEDYTGVPEAGTKTTHTQGGREGVYTFLQGHAPSVFVVSKPSDFVNLTGIVIFCLLNLYSCI